MVLSAVIVGMSVPALLAAQLWVAVPEQLVLAWQTVELVAAVVPEKLVPSLTLAELWVAVSLVAD